MKKYLLISILALFTLALQAQKIEKNEIDDFTGDKKIMTNWERLNMGNGITGKNHLYFRLLSNDGDCRLDLKWVTADRLRVDDDSKMLILQKDKSITEVRSLGDARAEKGGGSINIQMTAIEGIWLTYIGDFNFLSDDTNPVTKLRISTSEGYVDIELKDKNAKKLNKAYKLIEQELAKTE